MDFGKRIKAERIGLGMTQAAFAKKCSVHRNTQIKYESGEREPDAAYLVAMAEAGVDIGYVLTGRVELWEQRAMQHVLSTIQEHLKLVPQEDLWQEALCLAYDEAVALANDKDIDCRASRAIHNVLRTSPVVLDLPMLEDVIEKLEFFLEIKGGALEPHIKARAIVALYGKLRSGARRIEAQMVEEVLRSFV